MTQRLWMLGSQNGRNAGQAQIVWKIKRGNWTRLELVVRYQLTTLRFSGVRDAKLIMIQETFRIEIMGMKGVGVEVEAEAGEEEQTVVGEEGAGEDPLVNQGVTWKVLLRQP
jgi:hypothetical protein